MDFFKGVLSALVLVLMLATMVVISFKIGYSFGGKDQAKKDNDILQRCNNIVMRKL